MSKDFPVEVFTPEKKLANVSASEVVLPAYDGETGVLPDHGDFVGLLGTGLLRILAKQKETRLFVDTGIYRVKSGKLSVMALRAELAGDIDLEAATSRVEELDSLFSDHQRFSPDEFDQQMLDYRRQQARIGLVQKTEA